VEAKNLNARGRKFKFLAPPHFQGRHRAAAQRQLCTIRINIRPAGTPINLLITQMRRQ